MGVAAENAADYQSHTTIKPVWAGRGRGQKLAGGNLQNGDDGDEQRDYPGERALGEMPLKKFQVTATINDFIDSRLKEKHGEKRGTKDL